MEYTKDLVKLIIDSCSLEEFQLHTRTYYKEFCNKYPRLIKSCSELKYLLNNDIDTAFCPICGKKCNFDNHKACYYTYCSLKCRSNSELTRQKTENTCLKKYGVKNIQQVNNIKEQRLKTSKERYGNDYNNRSKAKETERQHYNGKVYFQTNEYKQFMKDNRESINNKLEIQYIKKLEIIGLHKQMNLSRKE